MKEKVQYLLYGKPLIINYTDDNNKPVDIKEMIGKDIKQLKLQEIMFQSEGTLFDNNLAHIIIHKTKDSVILRLADPHFPNVVRKYAGVPYQAEVWSAIEVGRANFWERTTYTKETIVKDYYGGESFSSKKKVDTNIVIDKAKAVGLDIKPEQNNPNGIIPVVEITFKPERDMSISTLKEKAPKHRLKELQNMLNEGTGALRLELFLNRTKMLIDQDLLDGASQSQLEKAAQENILAVLKDSGGMDGEGKVVEIIQGDPKVASYWENISNIISLAIQSLKLSELGEADNVATATGEIFNKGNDVETGNTLGMYRQNKISELLEKCRIIANNENIKEADIDSDKWGVQIVPNVIMNEAKMTDIVIAQLGAGLINMVQAKVKLENISQQDAMNSLSENDEFHNPTLLATSSFGNENDDKEQEQEGETEKDMNPTRENKTKPE